MNIKASKIKVIDDRLTYDGIDIGPADEFKKQQLALSSLARKPSGKFDVYVEMNFLSAADFVEEKIEQMSAHERLRFYTD